MRFSIFLLREEKTKYSLHIHLILLKKNSPSVFLDSFAGFSLPFNDGLLQLQQTQLKGNFEWIFLQLFVIRCGFAFLYRSIAVKSLLTCRFAAANNESTFFLT